MIGLLRRWVARYAWQRMLECRTAADQRFKDCYYTKGTFAYTFGEWALMASNLYGLLCQAVVSGDPEVQGYAEE